ncbi:protein ORF103 [Lake sturgeon herpesvirus]|nr:protein ORF103 [Lake sturgeon herpesvirus]
MFNPLQPQLSVLKTLVSTDLMLLKARLDDETDWQDDKEEEIMAIVHSTNGYSVAVHRAVYDRFMAPLGGPLTQNNHLFYGYVTATYDHMLVFLTYLYLRYLEEIDERGHITGLYQVSDRYRVVTSSVLELAHFYHLPWLQSLCRDLMSNPGEEMTVGPVLRRGDQLFVAGSKKLTPVGAPPHTKAITASSDGHTWYALSRPGPGLLDLWVRMYKTNHWRVLTGVKEQQEENASTYQLTLANGTSLYVLIDGRHLRCFDLVGQRWYKVYFNAPRCDPLLTFVMTETGDQSLTAVTLTANNRAGSVTVIQHHQMSWTATNRRSPEAYCQDVLTPQPTQWQRDVDPLRQVKGRISAIVNRSPRNLKNLLKKAKVTTLAEGLEALKNSGRYSQEAEFTQPDLQSRLNAMKDQRLNCQTPAESPWRRVTVVRGCLYGQKEDGRWFQNRVELGVYRRVTGWSPLENFGPAEQVLWNPLLDAVSTLRLKPGLAVLDGTEVGLDLFNPNYSDHLTLTTLNSKGTKGYTPSYYVDFTLRNDSMSGLDSLINRQKIKDPKTGVTSYLFENPHNVPAALDVLLRELEGPQGAELKTERSDLSASYPNGGIRKCPGLHPQTDQEVYELYTLTPVTVHPVQEPNLRRLLISREEEEAVFTGFVGCVYQTNRPTGYIFNETRRWEYLNDNTSLCAI